MQKVYYDLSESTYKSSYENMVFYFSSMFYKEKFDSNLEFYIKNENDKLSIRFGKVCDFRIALAIDYYRKIEKRGFRVYVSGKLIPRNYEIEVMLREER